MAINFPGPYEVRIVNASNEPAVIGLHQLRLSCDIQSPPSPGSPFGDWFPEQKGGGNAIALDTHVENLLGVLAPLVSSTSTFAAAELWEYASGTFDSIFRSAYTPVAVPTNANPTIIASQTYWTWRTQAGGIMKLSLMGSAIAAGSSGLYPIGEAIVDDVFDYMTDNSSPWIGRDGSYPLASLKFLPGVNEALWKRVYRS